MTSYAQEREVYKVAKQFHLNPQTLWGIYGTETSWGANTSNSSAGAEGPFQFIPSTATEFGLTTGPHGTVHNFQDSLVAAATYLVHLGANDKTNSPQTIQAINEYNGNGGGFSPNTSYAQSVLALGKETSLSTQGKEGKPAPGFGEQGAEGSFLATATPYPEAKELFEHFGWHDITDVIHFLASREGWIRILKVIGGGFLLYIAVTELFKSNQTLESVKQGAKKTAKRTGEVATIAAVPK